MALAQKKRWPSYRRLLALTKEIRGLILEYYSLDKLQNITEHQAYCILQMSFEFWQLSTDSDSEFDNLEQIFLIN